MADLPVAPSLARWLRPGAVLPDLRSSTADGVLAEIAESLAGRGGRLSAAALGAGFRERESLGSTAVGGGCAIPHCRIQGVSSVLLAVARHPSGVDFAAADGQPVRIFFALVAPQTGATAHLEALQSIARYLRDAGNRERLLTAGSAAELEALLLGVPVLAAASEVTADA